MKFVLYALILFLSVGIMLAREALVRFGLETNYLLIALIALAFTALLARRSVLLISLVVVLCVAVNVPPEALGSFRIDQDILVAALIAVIVLPVVHRLLVS